ncbi:MAG TPA: phospholipase D-like domain-containing protein, partial [Tepidisphaeraceae bacterium]|nr:phospholipase D-like domain-containing protein [Tepidisphaeraceae bacterium]
MTRFISRRHLEAEFGYDAAMISWLALYVALGWCVRALMIPVILRRQFAPGAAVAWLGIIFLHPYIGWTLYMLLGETRLGPHRVERHRSLVAHYRAIVRERQSAQSPPLLEIPSAYQPMVLQAEKVSELPVLGGNCVDFLDRSDVFVDRLVADIDRAGDQVHLLYYMFFADATGRRVAGAVERAARRGVKCRVLVDAVAGRGFFHRNGLGPLLAEAGVRVAAAQPVAPIQRRLPRMDLRNHRKLAVIDGRIAYAGSQNLVDPDYGGRRGAPWVDLSGRLTGPVVSELAAVFAEDWAFETGEVLDVCSCLPAVQEGGAMQVVPTGPTSLGESYRRVLLGALQCARRRAVLTTPYFVPDEPTLVALAMAADRGVEVNLLLPQTPDHIFTAAAGR